MLELNKTTRMNLHKYTFITCIGIAMFVLSGCAVRHGDFSVASNKLVRLSEFELDKADRIKGVIGKDVQHHTPLFSIGDEPSIEGAMDDAFAKSGGDVMSDAVIRSWKWSIWGYGQSGWSIEGDVVKTRRN